MNDSLIFGKSGVKKIVGIEPNDDTAELFIQNDDGTIKSEFVPNKYWILANKNPGGWRKLDGNGYYCYGKQYDDREEFLRARQGLKKRYDIYSIYDPKESLMVLKGYTYYRDLTPKDVSILSFDLETTTINHNDDAKILCISNTFRDSNGHKTKALFSYDDYDGNDGEMIEKWTNWVRMMDPSIITGHNINSFDFPYIQYIADKYDVSLKLGRDGSNLTRNDYESKFRKDGNSEHHYQKIKIYGREVIDTYFLAIRHDIVKKKYPSYGLKPIIAAEGLVDPNSTFYDASKIRENYKNPIEWAKIKEYCKDDSDDALKLFDLMAPAQFYIANSIPKPFQLITESATGSQLNSFLLRAYIQDAHSIPKASELSKVEGGISFGIPGIYSNVIKIDLKSAYPSQVLRFKLYDPIKDPKGYFYEMVKHFTYERFDLKKQYKETGDKYYSDREQAGKIVINSAYGLTNTSGLNFNNSDIANKITSETRKMIELSLKWSSNKDMDYYKQFMKVEEDEV